MAEKKIKAAPSAPIDVVLTGESQRCVATASGFIHAVARDLDLLTAGLMIGVGASGLIAKIEGEEKMLRKALDELYEAKKGLLNEPN